MGNGGEARGTSGVGEGRSGERMKVKGLEVMEGRRSAYCDELSYLSVFVIARPGRLINASGSSQD